MCFTALEPTRSATNSTVLRSDGGWLWKKACSRSTCQHTHTHGQVAPRRHSPRLLLLLPPHLQFLLGPVGSGGVPELSGGWGDLPDEASALGRASGHKRRQELAELACAGYKRDSKLKLLSSCPEEGGLIQVSLTQERTAGVEELLVHQSDAVLRNKRKNSTKET